MNVSVGLMEGRPSVEVELIGMFQGFQRQGLRSRAPSVHVGSDACSG